MRISKESSDPSAVDVAAGLYTTARTLFHYTVLQLSFTSKNRFAKVNFALFGTIRVRTLIILWTSFHKMTQLDFKKSSCFLSEFDHLAWMTCLSTSTQAGHRWPESRFYAPNIGSQTTWDNIFRTARKKIHQTLRSSLVCLLSRAVRKDCLALPFFRNVIETACMRSQMRLLLATPK